MRLPTTLAAIALLLASAQSLLADESYEEKFARLVARQHVIRFLTDRKFEIESDAVEATAAAVEPEERVAVELTEFILTGNKVSVELLVATRFKVEGKLADREELDVEAVVDIQSNLAVLADFSMDQGQLTVRARVHKWKPECEIVSVKPDDIKASDEMVGDLIRQNNDEFVRQMNDWLDENIKVESPPE